MLPEDSLVPINPALLALMHGSFGQNGALLPFAREIMLIECRVAGTSHREMKTLDPLLAAGAFLPLKREPSNAHDELAILILDEAGHQIGYIPRAKNEAIARLMDAGKLLFARLESKAWQGAWLQLEVRVFLRDY